MNATFDSCMLGSAEAEQEWIAQRIAAGIGRPELAWIEYAAPAIIYGRSTRPAADAVQRARDRGATVVQRRSGGGAVLAGPWMVGAALLLPPQSAVGQAGIVGAFRRFGQAWAGALGALGVPCQEATPEAMARHKDLAARAGITWVCFSGLSHGELTDAAGCKLLGLAQSRGKWGTLLSAGLLLGPVPWELLGWAHLGTPDWALGAPSSSGAAVSPPALRRELLQALGSSPEWSR
ncbi:lipoyl protein ligase domain-containing protein [Ramlibacter sp.]|uniref:lipoyl protein ligase domain-containing protein n=1 Tax=Ramlibacter sp. TaxID=1917967 RepID=UPI002B8ABB80|nr:ligase [Ramlibacter sp.]HWI84680.1 ligase [Ramlibacter sp.]